MNWTPEQDDLLREHWGKGLSAAKISGLFRADDVKISRMAVIGRAHRLKLPQQQHTERMAALRQAVGAAQDAPVKQGPLPRAKPTLAKIAGAPVKLQLVSAAPKPEPRALVVGALVPFIDLVGGQCKFIMVDDGAKSLCCGQPAHDQKSSWCSYHHGIVFMERPRGGAMRLQKMNGTR